MPHEEKIIKEDDYETKYSEYSRTYGKQRQILYHQGRHQDMRVWIQTTYPNEAVCDLKISQMCGKEVL